MWREQSHDQQDDDKHDHPDNESGDEQVDHPRPRRGSAGRAGNGRGLRDGQVRAQGLLPRGRAAQGAEYCRRAGGEWRSRGRDASAVSLHRRKLNSLGQEKLAKIVPDELEDDTVVYLNLPETAEKTAARRDDVMAYLKSLGVSEEHAKINLGTNPELAHPAEEGLTRLAKTETGATTSTDVAANAPATEGTGMGGMSNG